MNKLDEVYATICSYNVHIFAATETWLNEHVDDKLVKFPNFSHHRLDRKIRRGGGVCIWTHRSLIVKRLVPITQPECFDAVWLLLPVQRILFVCAYLPPAISSALFYRSIIDSYFLSNFDTFLTAYCDCDIILCGDLNRYNVLSVCDQFDIVNLVTEPTRCEAQLDYFIISSSRGHAYDVSVLPPISNADHKSILAVPKGKCTLDNSRKLIMKAVYDFRHEHVNSFVAHLSSINWTPFYLADLDINEKCDVFHETVFDALQLCIPRKLVWMSERDKPWLTPLVKFYIEQRWIAYRNRNFSMYHHLKAKVKDLIIKAKKKWASKAQWNSKHLWSVVNSTRGTKSVEHVFSLLQGFDSATAAANVINSNFASVFVNENKEEKLFQSYDEKDAGWSIHIPVSKVAVMLSKTKIGKSMGSDGIPTILYRAAADVLAPPLTHIFNMSISGRCFPKRWKFAHVSPLPKTSPPDIHNLRPISLLPLPSKILEKIVLQSVYDKFINNFGTNQFGSRPLSSTTCAVVMLLHHAFAALELPEVSGVKIIAYDFTKAFDKLSHGLILRRLYETRFPEPFIRWTANYLNDRKQSTRIGCTVSSSKDVPSGVPQGSVLGPMLFCLVVGCFKPLRHSTCAVQYVDDTTLCIPVFKCSDNAHVLEEHQHLVQWAKENGLIINLKKSRSLLIAKSPELCDFPLKDVLQVKEMQFLGVTLNDQLSWSSHISSLCRIASKRFYALRILKPLLPSYQLCTVYFGIIRSVLEYASPSFGNLPKDLNKSLEKIQNRCHRLICNVASSKECSCDRFDSLLARREFAIMKLFTCASNSNHVLHPIMPQQSHRSHRYIQPFCKTTRFLNSFIPFATLKSNDM